MVAAPDKNKHQNEVSTHRSHRLQVAKQHNIFRFNQ
jgi:hypothetical protein